MDESRKLLYVKVLGLQFSPDSKWLAVGTNFGSLALFKMSDAVDQKAVTAKKTPCFEHNAGSAVWSLTSSEDFLFCGSSDSISAWKWEELTSKSCKPTWDIPLKTENPVSGAHANSMVTGAEENDLKLLYAACEDHIVYCYDIESGELVKSFSGHTNYVHDVCLRNSGRECISASEDGTVRLWDTRSGREEHRLEPGKHSEVSRGSCGNWVSCVSSDDRGDWVVCGGGPALALWHLGSLSPANVYNTGDVTHYKTRLVAGSVFACSGDSTFRRWSLAASLEAEIHTSACELFSLDVSDSKLGANVSIVCGGAGQSIHVSNGLGYGLGKLALA